MHKKAVIRLSVSLYWITAKKGSVLMLLLIALSILL